MIPIHFSDNVPKWLQRLVRREYRRFGLDWRVSVFTVETGAINGRAGMAYLQTEYKIADIALSGDLRHDEEATHIVRHELLHLRLAPLQHYVETILPKRLPGRKTVLAHLDNIIETLIEELLRVRW